MLIIIRVIVAFMFLYFSGIGIVGLLSSKFRAERLFRGTRFIVPIVGYCFSQLLFWYGYALFENAYIAFTIVIGTLLSLFVIYLILRKRRSEPSDNLFTDLCPQLKDIKIWVVSISILFFCAWPYFIVGDGNYYHSGNEDFFDGINGGLAYLENQPLNILHPDFKGHIKLQYSSQAFWSILLLPKNPVDPFMIQCILNMAMTVQGVFWLLRYSFGISSIISIAGASVSVFGNLYFTTFLAGHIGSMMYGSVIPYFLGVIVQMIGYRREALRIQKHKLLRYFASFVNNLSFLFPGIFLSILFYLFIKNTYPGPQDYIIIPLTVFGVYELILKPKNFLGKVRNFYLRDNSFGTLKSQQFRRIIISVVVFAIFSYFFTIWLLEYFAPSRFFNIIRGSQEPWPVARYPEFHLIFWGLFPSSLVEMRSLFSLLYFNSYIYWICWILVIICYGITMYGVFVLSKDHTIFWSIFAIFWVLFMIMMKYFYGSGYYLYKFYYINFFLIIPVFIGGLFSIAGKNKLTLAASCILFFGLLVSNIGYNLYAQWDVINRVYHKVDDIRELENVLPEFNKISLDIPNEVNSLVLTMMFNDKGIEITNLYEAEFLLRTFRDKDVINDEISGGKTVWQNKYFYIIKKTDKNRITIHSQYFPDRTQNGPLRWIPDFWSEKDEVLQKLISNDMPKVPSDLLKKTYIDTKNILIYNGIQNIIGTNLFFERDPARAKYFLRLNDIVTLKGVRFEDFYFPMEGERKIWQGRFFHLVYLPEKGRKARFPKYIDVNRLLKFLRRVDGLFYVDIPRWEPMHHVLNEKCQELNNFTSDASKAEFFVRLDLPSEWSRFSQTFYLSMMENQVVWESGKKGVGIDIGLKVIKLPLVGRKKAKGIENSLPFDLLVQSKKFWPTFTVSLQNNDNSANYLNILIEAGPSIGFAPFTLLVEDINGNFLDQYHIDGNTFISIPISILGNLENPIVFRGKDLKGKSLMPVEPRILDFNVKLIEISSTSLPSKKALSLLDSLSGDIISQEAKNKGIFLGSGWYGLESFSRQTFRWGGQSASIVIEDNGLGLGGIVLDIEPGPSIDQLPLKLQVLNENNSAIDILEISGRQKVVFDLPIDKNKRYQVFKLKVLNGIKSIKEDPRNLCMRIFKIETINDEKKEL